MLISLARVTLSDLCNDIDDNISPTESETHAVGVAGVVVVVVDSTCCVDIVEVGSVTDIRRTQPPTPIAHTQRDTLQDEPHKIVNLYPIRQSCHQSLLTSSISAYISSYLSS